MIYLAMGSKAILVSEPTEFVGKLRAELKGEKWAEHKPQISVECCFY